LLIFQIQAQITVKAIHPDTNPLVDSMVKTLAGYGVSIYNISSNLKPSTKSMGTFKAGDSGFPLSKGLLMSNGVIDSIPKSNKLKALSSRMDYADTLAGNSIGKKLIQTILNKQSIDGFTQKSTEISSIKFDLLPVGDTLSFKYIFGSEEYPEFVCSQFNDIFGFFIKGPGIEGDSMYLGTDLEGFRNMAQIPGKNEPVTINSVNSGISGANGLVENCRFSPEGMAQFIQNDQPENTLYSVLQFDGLTQVLTAKSAVIPCQVYTLVLAISDVGDRLFDSGVFIEKGSMVSGQYSTLMANQNIGLKDTVANCHPGKLLFKRCPNINEKWTIRFGFEGTAVPNVDFKIRQPGGGLISVPDFITLDSNQVADSLLFEGTGSGFETKTLKIKYLDLQNPFIDSMPNYAGNETILKVRPFANQPKSQILGCKSDSAQVVFEGPKLPHIRYRWIGLEENSANETVSCDTCQEPKISVDSIDHRYAVRIENSLNQCFRLDTVLVSPKPFAEPVFQISQDSVSIKNYQTNYHYQWIVNGITALSNQPKIRFEAGEEINVEVFSPNGCHKLFNHQSIFTNNLLKLSESDPVQIYPNPCLTDLNLNIENLWNNEYEIWNLSGQKLMEGQIDVNKKINVRSLKTGLYTLKIKTRDLQEVIKRFSKQ